MYLEQMPLLAVGGLVLSACYSGNMNGPRTGVMGDSITALSAPDIESDIAEADPAGCVILTTLRPILDFYRAIPIAEDINTDIANLVQTDPHVHELDWATFSDENPRDISSDAVHPNAQGQADLAAMVYWDLHLYCGDPGGS